MAETAKAKYKRVIQSPQLYIKKEERKYDYSIFLT
jgi:hypothetical protein